MGELVDQDRKNAQEGCTGYHDDNGDDFKDNYKDDLDDDGNFFLFSH